MSPSNFQNIQLSILVLFKTFYSYLFVLTPNFYVELRLQYQKFVRLGLFCPDNIAQLRLSYRGKSNLNNVKQSKSYLLKGLFLKRTNTNFGCLVFYFFSFSRLYFVKKIPPVNFIHCLSVSTRIRFNTRGL